MNWYQESDLHPLVKSAVFHYEFEFIHPFSDGNGRIGRLWHTLLLGKWRELFYWLPIEDLIRSRQGEYYDALGKADRMGDCSEFVQLMLQIVHDTLAVYENGTDQDNVQDNDQVRIDDSNMKKLLAVIGNRTLSALEIMEGLGLSHRQTFRKNYLDPALKLGVIERTIPDKPRSRNQRYRKRTCNEK